MHFLPPRRCQLAPLSSSLFSLHFVENDSHPGRFMGSLDSHVPATPQILIDFFFSPKQSKKKKREVLLLNASLTLGGGGRVVNIRSAGGAGS